MWLETQPSAQYSLQQLNMDNSYQKKKKKKTRKIVYYIFEVLFNFTVFLYFVPNILSSIAVLKLLSFNFIL